MKLMRQLTTLVFSFGLLLVTPSVWAWGTQGHQVIASLAWAQITPAAKMEVNRLLALEPGETIVSISTWADEHRSPATAAWHYVNFPRDSCVYDRERDCPDGKCVVGAIEKQTEILQSRVINGLEKDLKSMN